MSSDFFKEIAPEIDINRRFEDPVRSKIKIVHLLLESSDSFKPIYSSTDIDMLNKLYVENLKFFEVDRANIRFPLLVPIEEIGNYKAWELDEVLLSKSYKDAMNILNGYGIASYDSSWHYGGAHFLLDYLILNTGYFYLNYGHDSGGSGSHPVIYLGRVEELDADILNKRHEILVGKNLIRHMEGDVKVLFMDESLNMTYMVKWSFDKRRKIVDIFDSFLKAVIDLGIYPVGVFYTRAHDIVRTLEYIMGRGFEISIQDKHLFNRCLEVGERSPVFKVYNPILMENNFDVACFYLKLEEGSVVRVEFPGSLLKFKDSIRHIHIAVYLQSLLGGGYPYCLVRAHESAVLSYEDRENIEYSLSTILNIPIEFMYSRKRLSKWRSIA